MYRQIAAAGSAAAVIFGAGAAALATSGSDATNGAGTAGSAATSAATAHPGARHRHLRRAALRRAVHGEIVTHGKDGFVTHSAIRGTVSGVSATSLTVKAADGFTQTFTLTKDTRVRERTPGQRGGKKGAVSDLHQGDKVAAFGKAAEPSGAKSGAKPTAIAVIDGLRK